MDLLVPYAKTDLAWDVIRGRSVALDAAMRALLIMMDGKRPLRDLLPAMKALSLKVEDVHALMERGFVRPCVTANAQQRRLSSRMALPAAEPDDECLPSPASAAPAVPQQKSLAAAKFYALDQLARILGRADESLRLASRDVVDRGSMDAWLLRCRQEIANVAGSERADLFAARVFEELPKA
ncbi:MAG: hypothetical protein ACOYNB_03905 [Aquabacterium sp.]|uniref:hypothetical protein n=1 Tax=Aquabacterium sp. TaxID=1872578 RepID=UPI003BC96AE1